MSHSIRVKNKINIKVIGVGGGGCNAVDCMSDETIEGVTFYGLNTDLQALEEKGIEHKIQIGETVSKGLGAGADPEIGRKAAEESKEQIMDILQDTDMVFITAGMGGGTGTGAAPIVAQYARELDILTIGVVTKPFDFENRGKFAKQGIEELEKYCDCLLVIPNQNLFAIDSELTMLNCFKRADDILLKSVKGIAEVITKSSLVNVDFADVKKVMSFKGNAMLGMGSASGENKIENALISAIETPLLETKTMSGAKGVLINISGDVNFSINDLNMIGSIIRNKADTDVVLITGVSLDNEQDDTVSITVVATDIDRDFSNEDILISQPKPKTQKTNDSSIQTKKEHKDGSDILPKEEKKDSPVNIPSFLKKRSE